MPHNDLESLYVYQKIEGYNTQKKNEWTKWDKLYLYQQHHKIINENDKGFIRLII